MMWLLMQVLVTSGIAFFITFLSIPLMCRLSHTFKLVDVPDGLIKTHERATPNLGGCAVYLGFIVAYLLCVGRGDSTTASLLTGLTLLFIVGFIDDRICLKPYQKLFGQFIAGVCFLSAGVYLGHESFSCVFTLSLSLLWILTLVNAFNLIDVMDGLAATVAVCAAATFLAVALYMNTPGVVLMLAAFLGAVVAFLWYNKPPACIYLGDAGALFIGGLLATIPFLLPWRTYTSHGYLIPGVILALPLLEVIILILIRFYKKIPIYLPSPDHFCLYFLRKGWSKKKILWYVVGMSTPLAAVSFLFLLNAISLVGLVFLGLCFVGVWLFFLTSRHA